MAGDSVNLICSVTLPDGVTGSPDFQWDGPGETPDPAAPSTSGQEVTSQLTLSAVRTSQAGQYTCTASLSDFNGNSTTDLTVQSESVSYVCITYVVQLMECICNVHICTCTHMYIYT